MLTIFKYAVRIDDRPIPIEMPWGARILHVAAQGDKLYPYLWALVDTEERLVERVFFLVGTGQPCEGIVEPPHEPIPPKPSNYIGTAHCGAYVWHVFEVRP